MQAEIIMGAGFSAVNVVFNAGGRIEKFPYSITICIGLAFYLLFSNHFKSIRNKNELLATISNLGILPIMILAVVIGPIFKETAWPAIEFGFSKPAFGEWSNWTILSTGFPPLSMVINAFPMVFSAYIILFGEMIQAQALIEDAGKTRKDE